MSEHTKEPWVLHYGAVATDVDNDGAVIIAERPVPSGGKFQKTVDANMRRIVACVNACAGIPSDDLELCPPGGLYHLAAHADQLVKQREELLAACKGLIEWDKQTGLRLPYKVRDPIRAAIASVKGGSA